VVQLTGHALLRARGIELIPVDALTYFTDPTPTAEMVRQILGAVSQFEKASLVAKLRHARERLKARTGRCEGRKSVPAEVVAQARRLTRKNPRTGQRRSLRQIAAELAKLGHLGPSGKPYFPASISHMLTCSGGERGAAPAAPYAVASLLALGRHPKRLSRRTCRRGDL
jgi:hypothetical protein